MAPDVFRLKAASVGPSRREIESRQDPDVSDRHEAAVKRMIWHHLHFHQRSAVLWPSCQPSELVLQNTGRSFHVPSASRTQGGPFMSLRPAEHRAVLSCPFGQQYTGRSFHVPSASSTQGGPFMSLRPAEHRAVLSCPFGLQYTGRSLIIIMYIYHALINPLSAHMIHINLNIYPFMSLRPAEHREVISCPFGQQFNKVLASFG